MNRIGILTAGGDAPALNATIHGAVARANELKLQVYGLMKGFNSLFNPRLPHVHLNPLFQSIPELDPTAGGTILGASRDYMSWCEQNFTLGKQSCTLGKQSCTGLGAPPFGPWAFRGGGKAQGPKGGGLSSMACRIGYHASMKKNISTP